MQTGGVFYCAPVRLTLSRSSPRRINAVPKKQAAHFLGTIGNVYFRQKVGTVEPVVDDDWKDWYPSDVMLELMARALGALLWDVQSG